MRAATILIQNAVRVLGVVLIVLGFLFWSRHAYNLVPLHMWLGVALIVLLWILAIVAAKARVSGVLVIVAILWGVLVIAFGMNMGGWLPGPAHEIIRVVHFLIGLTAIALSESLSARIKRRMTA